MDYMFLLYRDESKPMSPEEGYQARSRQWAIIDDTKRKGVFRAAGPLQSSSSAVSVRAKDGHVVATDGPFTETKEALAGYYILDCSGMEEARYWAGRIAQTGCAHTVEIRPMRELPARIETEQTIAVNA